LLISFVEKKKKNRKEEEAHVAKGQIKVDRGKAPQLHMQTRKMRKSQ